MKLSSVEKEMKFLFVCVSSEIGINVAILVSSGLLLGKDHHEHASPALASSAHAKTGSKDSSTQTDKSTELFWPSMASLPTRGRLSVTPSNSPILKHPGAKGTAEKPGMASSLPLL